LTENGLFVVIILCNLHAKRNSCLHFVWIKTWGPYNYLLDCLTSVILRLNKASLEIYKALPHLPHYGIPWSFCVHYGRFFRMKNYWMFLRVKNSLAVVLYTAPSMTKELERKQIRSCYIRYKLFLNICWLHVSVFH